MDNDREIRRLQQQVAELSALVVKNDEELRKKIRDIRIKNIAGVVAAEFTLARRLGITIDVVLQFIPEEHRAAIEKVIDRRVSELPDTTAIAIKIAEAEYKKGGEYGE